MPDIHHRLIMSAPRDEVFTALTRLVQGRALEVGARARMVDFDRDARAVWRCDDGPDEWVGTEIAIELANEGRETIVSFVHRNWREATDAMASCTTRWGSGLLGLQRVVEIPEPDDVRV
jgi:hypothetical protein